MAKNSIVFISLLFTVFVVTSDQLNFQNNCNSEKCLNNNRTPQESNNKNSNNGIFNMQTNLSQALTEYQQNLNDLRNLRLKSLRLKIQSLENTIKLKDQNITRCELSFKQRDFENSKLTNELQSHITQKEVEVSTLKNHINNLQSALNNSNIICKNNIQKKDNDLVYLKNNFTVLQNIIDYKDSEINMLRDQLQEKTEMIIQLEESLSKITNELQSQITQKEVEVSNLKNNIYNLQIALNNSNIICKNNIQKKDNDFIYLKNNFTIIKNTNDFKDSEINMFREMINKLETKNANLQKQNELNIMEINRWRSNNKTVSTQLENCTNEYLKLKADSIDITAMIPENSFNESVFPVASTSSPIYRQDDVNFRTLEPDNCPAFGNNLGAHLVTIADMQTFSIPCNSDSSNKHWSVIQRRLDQTLSFNRDWREYREGFGDHKSEFFIGLEKIHLMTSSKPHELLIRLGYRRKLTTALYSHFEIAGEDEDYKLISVGNYSGNAGDGMRGNEGQKFSTLDRDNDLLNDVNCAEDSKGAWWLSDCGITNLNLKHYSKVVSLVLWNNWMDPIVSIEMMIRPT